MSENLTCGETSDSWIIDNDDEINYVGGFTNEIDYNHNELFSKVDNFVDNRSIPMIDSPSSLREERIREMVERETEFLPGTDYVKRLRSGDFELLVRNQSLDWISKVCDHYNFGPLSIYLSMNYLDRFLTSYELPKDKDWAVQLLAVSCLSLAIKMEEPNVPQTIDLQVQKQSKSSKFVSNCSLIEQVGDSKFVFEAKTIKRMELLVLNTLNWRLNSITPFSFIDYYINNINGYMSENSIYRCSQFILNTTKEIEFLDFRPSEIAAAAAMSVSISGDTKCFDDENSVSNRIYVKQERVKRCLNLMRNLREENDSGARFSVKQPRLGTRMVPESPIGVLEVTCLSYKSEDKTVESCTNSSLTSPDNNNSNKRRRKQ